MTRQWDEERFDEIVSDAVDNLLAVALTNPPVTTGPFPLSARATEGAVS